MMKKTKIKSFRINSDIYDLINDFISNNGHSFSDIVNYALYDLMVNKSDKISNEFKKIKKYNENSYAEKDLHIYLSKKDYEYLKELSIKHGFSSVSKEAKFLLLNLLNSDSPLFNNIEMTELKIACMELNKIGRNINQILKVLYEQDFHNFKINYENLMTAVNTANEKISNVVDPIEKYIELLNLKLKS